MDKSRDLQWTRGQEVQKEVGPKKFVLCCVDYIPGLHNPTQSDRLSFRTNSGARGTTPILEKNAPRMQGQMKIFRVGSRQFREPLRELLRELWVSY